jgi:hypothetical protein
VAIGKFAGGGYQGVNSVAIGNKAGNSYQGINSIAIGANAGYTSQANNSIILNATGANLNQTTANTFTVAPIRNDTSNIANVLYYNTTSKEITYAPPSPSNGTSNVSIPSANGNVNIVAAGNTTVVVTGTGANITGTLNISGLTTITSYTETVVALGTVTSTAQLAITAGTIITATLTASTPCTFAMPISPVAGQSFVLRLTQAATGMTTAAFTGVKWPGGVAPTITATASAVDIISFVFVGGVWYGNAAQAFA